MSTEVAPGWRVLGRTSLVCTHVSNGGMAIPVNWCGLRAAFSAGHGVGSCAEHAEAMGAIVRKAEAPCTGAEFVAALHRVIEPRADEEIRELTGQPKAEATTGLVEAAKARWPERARREAAAFERLTAGPAQPSGDAGGLGPQGEMLPRAVCPCSLVTPCRPSCSCGNSVLSGGCDRCASYGSFDQQLAAARRLAERDARIAALEAERDSLKHELACAVDDYKTNTRQLADCGKHYDAKVSALEAERDRLRRHIDDLQSGMWVNCVYCGHRYGPGESTPVFMADALKTHVERCPQHPMAALRERTTKVEAELETARNDIRQLTDELASQTHERGVLEEELAEAKARANEIDAAYQEASGKWVDDTAANVAAAVQAERERCAAHMARLDGWALSSNWYAVLYAIKNGDPAP